MGQVSSRFLLQLRQPYCGSGCLTLSTQNPGAPPSTKHATHKDPRRIRRDHSIALASRFISVVPLLQLLTHDPQEPHTLGSGCLVDKLTRSQAAPPTLAAALGFPACNLTSFPGDGAIALRGTSSTTCPEQQGSSKLLPYPQQGLQREQTTCGIYRGVGERRRVPPGPARDRSPWLLPVSHWCSQCVLEEREVGVGRAGLQWDHPESHQTPACHA